MENSSLSNYKIIRPIGGGTFGRVKCKGYLVAEHLNTGTLVAMKILNKLEIQERRTVRAVEREIRILEDLCHPNVVRLYDCIETSTNLIIVMEYMAGGELYNIVDRHKVNEDEAKKFFWEVLLGIEYLHSKGYAHRDIKPENILLNSFGTLKISDFGLSNILLPGCFLKTQCGSPNYAAPELISGDKYCGTEVDIWSLGVVLYALTSNILPFDDPSIPVTLNLIKRGKYRVPSYYSEELKDLVSRMLCVDPISRITISQIKAHPWLQSAPDTYLNSLKTLHILKLYTNPDIQASVLHTCLQIPEFKHISEKDAKKMLKFVKRKFKKEKLPLGLVINRTFISTFLITLDQKIKGEKNLIKRAFNVEKQNLFKGFSAKSSKKTSASSLTSESSEKLTPNNWVYGFRSNLEYGFFATKLFEGIKKLGFVWKHNSKSSFDIKLAGVKVFLQIFKFEATFVVDFLLVKGKTFEFLESVSSVYAVIYEFTHNSELIRKN